MEGINLSKAYLEFCQDGNTCGTTEEIETLEVHLESPLFIDNDGHFFVFKSSSGWSFNDPKEFLEIINKCDEVGKLFFKGNKG